MEELKREMLENAIHLLRQVSCENISDITYKYNDDGAVDSIEIYFDHSIYLTNSKG